MIAFFSIVIAVALLGVTVYGLHRYQTIEVEYNVDRNMPLPPLDAERESPDSEQAPGTVATDTDSEGEATERTTPGSASGSDREAAARAPRSGSSQTAKNSWLEKVATLKRNGDLNSALALCRAEFPLWGAYNQACIVRRAQIKDAEGDSGETEQLLRDLYRLAAIAELLHDKSPESEPLSPAQLREMKLDKLEELDFPYREIGYAHLRLIRKSDIKLMQSLWGRPQQHQPPRQLHHEWWLSAAANS